MKLQFLCLAFCLLLLISCKQETPKISSLINYQGAETFSVISGSTVIGKLKTLINGDKNTKLENMKPSKKKHPNYEEQEDVVLDKIKEIKR